MFSWRYLKEEDYDQLIGWWKWFRFPVPTKEMLPSNGKGGVMIYKDGVDICAGFLYQTNSAFCFVEYIVSNPEYRDKDRADAIEFLLKTMIEIAGEVGCGFIFSFVRNENLINRMTNAGFIKGSESIELVKII